MKYFILFFTFLIPFASLAQQKTIHTYVALCDNANQGIVPVPAAIGNGQDPKTNLYWGAAYGLKNFLKNKTNDWKLIKTLKTNQPHILERLLFEHKDQEVYLIADAYDGAFIKDCIEDFLCASNGQNEQLIDLGGTPLKFGGGSNLVAFLGHNGLMDFEVNVTYKPNPENTIETIILACYSQNYFSPELKAANATPLLWTTHLMAPEAYTFKDALDGWILNKTPSEIEEIAAQTYNQYQKCGIKGARNLFTTGY